MAPRLIKDFRSAVSANKKRFFAAVLAIACIGVSVALAFSEKKVDWTIGLVFPLSAGICLFSIFLLHFEYDPVNKRFIIKMQEMQQDVAAKKEYVAQLALRLAKLAAFRAFFEMRCFDKAEFDLRDQGTSVILNEVIEMLKPELPAAPKIAEYISARDNRPWRDALKMMSEDLGVPYNPPPEEPTEDHKA